MKNLLLILAFICVTCTSAKAKEYTYYYYPKYEAYYRVETKTWFYREGCSWTVSRKAPKGMPVFFLRKNHRVLLRYKGPNPLVHHITFTKKYSDFSPRRVAMKKKDNSDNAQKKKTSKVIIYTNGRDINN
jgi:hypothetical protein